MRSRRCSSIGPAAPVLLSLPTSSWSSRAMTRWASVGSAASRASVAIQHDSWLSRRPAASSDASAPSTAAGVRSNRHNSHQPRSAAGTSRRSASQVRKSPSRQAPVPHTGVRCCCLSSCRPRSFTSRSRWMASCGTRHTASSTAMSTVAPSRSTTRPAIPRSRSSHEFRSTPPYTSTPSWRHPLPPVSGRGFTRRHGESVWAPMMRNGVEGVAWAARRNATTDAPFTTRPASGRSAHVAVVESGANPASSRRATVDEAACHGEGDESRKSMRSSRRPGA